MKQIALRLQAVRTQRGVGTLDFLALVIGVALVVWVAGSPALQPVLHPFLQMFAQLDGHAQMSLDTTVAQHPLISQGETSVGGGVMGTLEQAHNLLQNGVGYVITHPQLWTSH